VEAEQKALFQKRFFLFPAVAKGLPAGLLKTGCENSPQTIS